MAPNLRRVICSDDQKISTENGSVHDELDEEFEGRFRHNASHPMPRQ